MDKYNSIHIDREGKDHIYIQLFNEIKNMIENNVLDSHEKLPPIRKLADHLNVNNVTVVNAYNKLEKYNFVYKKIGSGTFVLPKPIYNQEVKLNIIEDEIYEDLELMDRGHIQIRKDRINFASGTPTPELFPIEDFKVALNEILDRDKGFAFGYQESKGYYQLRESIVDYLKHYEIDTRLDNVQVISGAQQGIDVVSKALLNHGDAVIVESPTYTGAIAAFKSRGAKIIEVPILEDGIDLYALEIAIKKYKPKLIYTMPNFQNPTGYSYSLNKKKKLLELVAKDSITIIEDDYLSDLNFYSSDSITLKSIDKNENVIYIKSFSKIFMPGLRLGFLVVPLKLNDDILMAKHTSDISTSGLIQRAFDLYLRKGIWRKHIAFMKEIYRERFDVMVESLENHLNKNINFVNPKGGINFWIRLPEGFSTNELYSESINKKLIFVPGGVFYPNQRESNCLRLSIAAVYPEEIRKGILLLGNVSESFIKSKDFNDLNRKNTYAPIL